MASEKRKHDVSKIAEVVARDLAPGPDPGHTPGGRQEIPGRPAAGGGYRHICMKIDAAVAAPSDAAAALEDLTRIGLSRAWLDVARAIGYEAFMVAWQILAGHPALDDRGRIVVPVLGGLIRYRRNQFVRAMVAAGAADGDIVDAVKRTFGETLKDRNLRRLRAPAKVKP